MEILLILVGIICLIGGVVGAVLPPLPGPPLSFVGILALHYSEKFEFTSFWLVSFGIATIVITVLDYYVPIWGVKRFGGTKYGIWGTTIGLLVGFFFPIPGGIFLGAFAGAFIGELLGGLATQPALKAAIGSFLGFLAGIFMKTVLSVAMLLVAIKFWLF